MKCPKCGYLGFEHVDRCRHCGYEFSLSQSVSIPELPIRSDTADERPLDDLSLLDVGIGEGGASGVDTGPGPDRVDGVIRPTASSAELPLFRSQMHADDEPLIIRASRPRAPLAVRRSTPEGPRLRAEPPRAHTLDLGLDLGLPETAQPSPARDHRSNRISEEQRPEPILDAALGARFLAVAVDLMILAVVDALVVYFTMKICGLTVRQLGLLPKGPLLAFLLVQNGGYLVAFTAGGQTIGKMAVGIKVVTTGPPSSLDLGRAFLREALWLVLAVPAGLGFLTLLAGDHRGLHDRFAGTRVVR